MTEDTAIRLTQYSHGGGCGCKIAPLVLEDIIKTEAPQKAFKELLVGNGANDDAAVYQINETEAIISTTDFFMPIVDDAYTFGCIAAANAISDVYAMGGEPIMALAILGWPVDTLPASLARRVLEGARSVCATANIPLAGGHSIDSKEPIFGLSVNGRVQLAHLKQNNTAKEGDVLFLTKRIGVGILSTAAKRSQIEPEDLEVLYTQLTKLNSIGAQLGKINAVHAMTDVTGFGLGGHLIEMAEGSNLTAIIDYQKVPKLACIKNYIAKNIFPDATSRNWKSIESKLTIDANVDVLEAFKLLPDPQTNGGLLIAVDPNHVSEIRALFEANGYGDFIEPIGKLVAKEEKVMIVR